MRARTTIRRQIQKMEAAGRGRTYQPEAMFAIASANALKWVLSDAGVRPDRMMDFVRESVRQQLRKDKEAGRG